jgi:hypothetical protein
MASRASKPALGKWVFQVMGIVLLASGARSAYAGGLHGFAAGMTLPQPVGTASTLLNHPAGVQLDAWLDGPSLTGEYLKFQVTGRWEPFKIVPIANTNLHLFSLLGGVHATSGGPGFLGLMPFVSLQGGPVYESLNLAVSSAIANTAWSFAVQVMPGVDITIYKHLGLAVSFPYEVILVKNPVAIWSSVFSVRWKL